MEVLLRKASTLARACSAAATKLDVSGTFKLSIYSWDKNTNTGEFLTKTAQATSARVSDALELFEVCSQIRTLIGVANNETVSALLAERDCLNSQEKILVELLGLKVEDAETKRQRRYYGSSESSANVKVEHNANTLDATLENLRVRSATTGELPQMEVSALMPAAVSAFENRLAGIRRRRSDLMDELAAANLNKKIRLSDNIVRVLQKHRIV